MSSQEILDLHIEDAEDISRIVPGVSFAAHNNGPNGPGQDNLTIRGVSRLYFSAFLRRESDETFISELNLAVLVRSVLTGGVVRGS